MGLRDIGEDIPERFGVKIYWGYEKISKYITTDIGYGKLFDIQRPQKSIKTTNDPR